MSDGEPADTSTMALHDAWEHEALKWIERAP